VTSPRAAEILGDLAGRSADDAGLTQQLVSACAAGLAVGGAGISVVTDGGPRAILGATDQRARTVEELQFSLGEGPCIEASELGRPVLLPELATDATQERFPAFAAGALAVGVGAVFAFPVQVGGIRLGVLDIYRDTAGGLSGADLTEALAFADAAVVVLLHTGARTEGGDLAPWLSEPLSDRAEVHQATGMVAVQAGVSLAEALLLLRARAYAEQRPVQDVAGDVVARRVRLEHVKDHDG
jgi:hypothetical protein